VVYPLNDVTNWDLWAACHCTTSPEYINRPEKDENSNLKYSFS
jgi:hypothetical protein